MSWLGKSQGRAKNRMLENNFVCLFVRNADDTTLITANITDLQNLILKVKSSKDKNHANNKSAKVQFGQ